MDQFHTGRWITFRAAGSFRLTRQAAEAATADQIRDAIRDLRHHITSASSLAHTRELEARLRDLETQIKTATIEQSDHSNENAAITLESLKNKRVLFAIMPFQETFADVWEGGIKRAANGTGLTPIRIDNITASTEITDDIVATIELAEVVVVDVTNNNPNVMFEFGFALAKNKPHAIISQSTDFLTFDIKNLRTIIYKNSWKGIEALHKDLQTFIRGAIGNGSPEGNKPRKQKGTKK